jgi:transcription antitermination factor NusG
MWYALHLFVELDKFEARYHLLPKKLRSAVFEMVTLRQASKSLYQRDLSLFVGYAFVKADPKMITQLNSALRGQGLAEVLTAPGSRFIMPMRPEEVQWVYELLQSRTDTSLPPGTEVRITSGPFEGMEGVVDSVVGQQVAVRVPLRCSTSLAYCTPDTLDKICR